MIPLLAERREIRPEAFSYFFAALFFSILWRFRGGRLAQRWLWLAPVLEIFWVNTHIYFLLGPFLIAVFFLEALWLRRGREARALAIIFFAALAAIFVNPFGIDGVLYPLGIFRNYGYRIIENQSVWFLWPLVTKPNLILFPAVFTVTSAALAIALWKNRGGVGLVLPVLGAVFGVMAWLAIRNMTLFAFFAIPLLAISARSFGDRPWSSVIFRAGLSSLAAAVIAASFWAHRAGLSWQSFGLGLYPGNNQAAEFFKGALIRGPIFNNYDIGSYLIYHLFARERVFVDNRPEAYPASFFKDVYIPMQEKPEVWRDMDRRYGFGAIIFAWHDATPWAQQFQIERIADPRWAPVFVDSFVLILLKRNAANRPVIERYEIPRSRFSVVKNL